MDEQINIIKNNCITKINRYGLVIFAGAGMSVDAPSNVPGWHELNTMILTALKNRVTNYLERNPIWLDEVISGVIKRRNANRYPPEYQAQIMAEQSDESYFEALASVDLIQRNKSHVALSLLASAGILKGIVTTNFDRLIEQGLKSNDLRFKSFINEKDFKILAESRRNEDDRTGSIPVIKIHGSVELPTSMIDTLQQRLHGKKELLETIVKHWLGKHFVIYAGFSAADLNHNPNYLGICESAKESPGAIFIQYPGSKMEIGAEALLKSYNGKAYKLESKLNYFCYAN